MIRIMPYTMRDLGRVATEWRHAKGYDTHPAWVGLKLVEEVGETVRALIAEHEGRPGRGDVVQEAAQTVIVLASLLHIVHPEASLFDEVMKEMDRLAIRPSLRSEAEHSERRD